MKQAHVPDAAVFATKPTLALTMIEQCIDDGVFFTLLLKPPPHTTPSSTGIFYEKMSLKP